MVIILLVILVGIVLVLVVWSTRTRTPTLQKSPSPREDSQASPSAPSASELPAVYERSTLVSVPFGEVSEAPRGILIQLVDVEDRRCPLGVECASAGYAQIQARIWPPLPPGVVMRRDPPPPIALTIPGSASRTVALPTEANTREFPEWRVVFSALEPYPTAAKRVIEKSSYVASFSVLPVTGAATLY